MDPMVKTETGSAYLQTFKMLALLIGIILASFYLLSAILLPVIIAFVLYALLEPITLYLVRKNVNHSLAIVLLLIIMLAISVFAISFALPQLFDQVSILKTKFCVYYGTFGRIETVTTFSCSCISYTWC